MVEMINGFHGNKMYVAEDRVEEYLKAGHKLANVPKPAKVSSKKTPKKSTKKK